MGLGIRRRVSAPQPGRPEPPLCRQEPLNTLLDHRSSIEATSAWDSERADGGHDEMLDEADDLHQADGRTAQPSGHTVRQAQVEIPH